MEVFTTETLKALVNERLRAAADDIFSIFETTLRDYEEFVLRSKHQRRREKASVQLPVQEEDTPCGQSQTDPCADDQETPRIKEEQEELWTTREKQQDEESDSKDSMFNIIYVQQNKEDGRENKEKLKSDVRGVSQPSTDCPMSETSDDERGDDATKPQRAGGTGSDRPHTCSVCNKNFRIKSILTRHMKTHTGEKPYSCWLCGKSFIQRSYLQTHMNSHSGQKPHTCSFCGKGFTQVGNMNAHIRIHTGEKPHSCSHCGKSFREKADLIKHTVIHTGEKPYVCTVCDMRFSAQSNLTRHMKTHSGERPYGCSACGKKFLRRSHLNIHMKTHIGGNL